jgi:hypothetical protein
MLESSITPPRGLLFEATLEPAALGFKKMTKDAGLDEGEINLIRGKRNKVAVGEPYSENLTSRLRNLNEEIPYEIKRLTKDYDFYYVRLTCSFLPDKDCRFDWARFTIELNVKSKSGEKVQTRPIAWDMSPNEVFSEIKYKRAISFTPELKFSIISEVLDAGIQGGINESKEYVIYEPQITSRFLVGAHVSSHLLKWMPFPVTERKDGIVDKEYEVSE